MMRSLPPMPKMVSLPASPMMVSPLLVPTSRSLRGVPVMFSAMSVTAIASAVEGVDRAADRRVVDVDVDVEQRVGLEVEPGAGLQPQRRADILNRLASAPDSDRMLVPPSTSVTAMSATLIWRAVEGAAATSRSPPPASCCRWSVAVMASDSVIAASPTLNSAVGADVPRHPARTIDAVDRDDD